MSKPRGRIRPFLVRSTLALAALIGASPVARANVGGLIEAAPDAGPALLCRGAIAATEAATHIPDAFLSAIGRVESGRILQNGMTAPWPWTVNAAGVGHFYASKADAVAAVRQFQADGIHSLDLGCLQVNIMYHPDAFASPDQAFDPATNVAYAAKLLISLHDQTGSWPRAAAAYHSQTPALGQPYQARVLAAWAEPDGVPERRRDASRDAPHASRPATVPAAPDETSASRQTVAALPAASTFAPRAYASANSGAVGRSLAAYRAMPVQMAARSPVTSIMRY